MTAMARVQLILFIFFTVFYFSVEGQSQWPVPYKRFKSRPKFNPYCHAGVAPYCPTGNVANTMPRFEPEDNVEVYALKAPVFEFKFGDLLGKYHIMHDAVAFKNLNTGWNYTLEWYELAELFNCTFAHVLKNGTFIWCNQGGACVYDGVDDKHWIENGTLAKIADITGSMFNDFAEWVLRDNNTAIYYETWTVWDSPGGKMWFDSFDCASFVLRALKKLGDLGTKFNQSVQLNYTRINLYSDEPIYLGNETEVFENETLAQEITDFFVKFQSHQSFQGLLEHMIEAYAEIFEDDKFYLFYNYEYWFLPMKAPYMKLTFYEIPLPQSTTLYYEKQNNPSP